jgi:hypothetical protein
LKKIPQTDSLHSRQRHPTLEAPVVIHLADREHVECIIDTGLMAIVMNFSEGIYPRVVSNRWTG